MKEAEFDKFITHLKAKPMSACPAITEANVFRKIRLANEKTEAGFWTWMGSLSPRAGFLFAITGMTLLVTSIATIASLSVVSQRVERAVETNRILDLTVFKGTELINFNNPLSIDE